MIYMKKNFNYTKSIISKIKNKIHKFYSNIIDYSSLSNKICYSQYGEDNIIAALLGLNKVNKINYIDIGANDPYKLNNTALFYESNHYGINIEPDPVVFKKLSTHRKKDINLNIGIGDKEDFIKYYQFEDSVYNSFSLEEAENIQKKGKKLISTINLKINTYNYVVQKYLKGIPPIILFLDAEGFDEIIIDSINFNIYAPSIICVETFAYGMGIKNHILINKILGKGYEIHADTFVNTIFVKKNTFIKF